MEQKYLFGKKENYSNLTNDMRDLVSHFILRLAYCRSEDLRRWFLNQECALFKYRLNKLDEDQRATFMHENGVNFAVVSTEEKLSLRDKLVNLCGITDEEFLRCHYYKIPFQQALTLISTRQVYLRAGLAYVPVKRLVSIITTRVSR